MKRRSETALMQPVSGSTQEKTQATNQGREKRKRDTRRTPGGQTARQASEGFDSGSHFARIKATQRRTATTETSTLLSVPHFSRRTCTKPGSAGHVRQACLASYEESYVRVRVGVLSACWSCVNVGVGVRVDLVLFFPFLLCVC